MIFSGEKGFEPSSDAYVKAYIKFYAKRKGVEALESLNKDGTDDISMQAKTHLVDDLYKNLDTLDSKASAILTFCGVVLALITVMLSSSEFIKYKYILYLLFVSVSISSVLALSVVSVHWANARELGHRTLEEACHSYYSTKVRRTRRYIISWYFITVSVYILGGYILLDAIFLKSGLIG